MAISGTGVQTASTGTGEPSGAHIYNKQYAGPTYSVKYLGIVDGSMGILSRKMALQNIPKDSQATAGALVKSPILAN